MTDTGLDQKAPVRRNFMSRGAPEQTTYFTPTDLGGITVSEADGGCGKEHRLAETHSLECDLCGPFVSKWYGANTDRKLVALSAEEQREQDKLSDEGGKRVQEITRALAQVIADGSKSS
jgi:hypothetical protein